MKGIGLVFGLNIGVQLGYYDQDSQLLKTLELSLFEDLIEYLVRLPRSGMILSGRIYEQRTWAHRTGGKEYGLLPTPTKRMWKGASPNRKVTGSRLEQYLYLNHGGKGKNYYPHPAFVEQMMGFPKGWTESKDLEMQLFLK